MDKRIKEKRRNRKCCSVVFLSFIITVVMAVTCVIADTAKSISLDALTIISVTEKAEKVLECELQRTPMKMQYDRHVPVAAALAETSVLWIQIRFENGDIYEGEFSGGRLEGTGTYQFADGDTLEGRFTEGSFVSGLYVCEKDGNTYRLTVKNGRLTGRTDVLLANGDEYVGKLIDGVFSGNCTVLFADGDQYTGHINANLKEGRGTYIWSDGAYYYGFWSNDKMNGNGIYHFSKEYYPLLRGMFTDNQPEGTCIYEISAQEQYSTVWQTGKCVSIQTQP